MGDCRLGDHADRGAASRRLWWLRPGFATVAALVAMLAALSVGGGSLATTPSGGPSAPPEAPAASSAGALPPPPAWFDPGTIAYLGSRGGVPGSLGRLWYGRLDGTDLRPVPVEGHGIGIVVGDGGIVVNAPGPAGSPGNGLVLVRSDGSATDLLDDQSGYFVANAGGDVVYAFRADGRTDSSVSGLWRVPLDGSRPTRVLPAAPGASHVAVSADERSFAMGWKIGDEPEPITARFDMGRPRRPVEGLPQGFDAAGRLIFQSSRHDPDTGRTRRIEGMGRSISQIVNPDGRSLVAVVDTDLLALDLVTGRRRSWALGPGDWFVTELSTDRYAVAARFLDDPDAEIIDVFAVVDLYEGWLGFVPFHVPPRADG